MAFRPMFGRAAELAELVGALERTMEGHGGVVLLAGEPGIGKTRLAEALADEARRRGGVVSWGRAWEAEGAPACWPWIQILRGRGDAEAALAPLLAPATGGDAELALARAGWAIAEELRRRAAGAPLVVVLDDLHAADITTLRLLQLVAAELRAARVLFLGTYRAAEARAAPGVAPLLARVARGGTTRPLGPLPRAAVTAWVESAIGAAPAAAAALFAASEGNPLFVDALLQLVAARGDAALPPRFTLPDTIREIVDERLRRLAAPARELLEAAAVLGRECERATLERVGVASPDALLEAIGAGVAAGVLEEADAGVVRFAHALVREAVLQSLPPGRRVELHGRAARALAADREAHLAELAHHAYEAGAWIEAAALAADAGARAAGRLAFDEAAAQLERALAALRHAGDGDDARVAELTCRLGEALLRSGRTAEGREQCERAVALAARLERPDLAARAALAFGVEIVPGQVDARLVELLEGALRAGPDDAALRARLTARLAAALMPAPEPERPHALAREAIAAARGLGDRRVLAQVLATARAVFTPADDLDERVGLDRELAALGAALGDRLLELQAHARLALDAVERGDAGEVALELGVQAALADEIRLPRHQLAAAFSRLLWATLRDDVDEIARAEARINELAEDADGDRARAVVEANRLSRAEARGDVVAADAARAALEAQLLRDRRTAWWLPLRRAAAHAAAGRLDEARAEILRFAPGGPQGAHRGTGPAIPALMAGVYAALGDAPGMSATYELLLPYAERLTLNMPLMTSEGPVALHLGRLAAALGRHAVAAAHLDAAAAVCARAGLAAFAARVGRELERLGRPAAAPATAPPPDAAPPRLTRDGETWTLAYAGRELRLRDSKGLRYLAALVAAPGRELHVGELVGAGALLDGGDAGELLDARARAAYAARLARIDDALEDADGRGDRQGAARWRAEREALAGELARAVGLGGRGRRAGAASERARINVQRRLRDVIRRVAELDAPLGRVLDLHVKTGVFCSWQP